MSLSPAPSARFALALVALDGVGRVTAHRILERFPTLDALRATPREQVLLRLKGAPHAERTVAALFDDGWSGPALDAADAEIAALAGRGLSVLAPGADAWPAGLDDLDRSARPVTLLAYGPLGALARPLLAVLGASPVDPEAFEAAQALARQARARGASVVVGLTHGFDVALAKVSAGGAVAVAACGLARLSPSLRPAATQIVRSGGVLLSPFAMEHGPFAHDAREAALVQAAMARAVVAAGVENDSPEARAAAWARGAGRPVAALPPVPPALDDGTVAPEAVLDAL